MVQDEKIPVNIRPAHLRDGAGVGGVDIGPFWGGDVQAGVEIPAAGDRMLPEAEGGGKGSINRIPGRCGDQHLTLVQIGGNIGAFPSHPLGLPFPDHLAHHRFFQLPQDAFPVQRLPKAPYLHRVLLCPAHNGTVISPRQLVLLSINKLECKGCHQHQETKKDLEGGKGGDVFQEGERGFLPPAAAHRGAPSPVHRHCSVVPVSHFPIPPSLQSMKKRDKKYPLSCQKTG